MPTLAFIRTLTRLSILLALLCASRPLHAQSHSIQLEKEFQTELHKQEAEKQEQLIAFSKAESEIKTILWTVIGAAATLLLIIAISLGALFKELKYSQALVKSQKEGLERYQREKSSLLKELNHRVKNNLQMVSSLLNLQRENVADETTKRAFIEGQNRVEAMAMIHRHLYATEQVATLKMEKYFTQLVQSTAYSYGYSKRDMNLKITVTSEPISADVAIPLGLIANELVSNAFKHAFKHPNRPRLRIDLNLNKDLTLSVCDNGPGMPEQRNIESGSFGMDLIDSLVLQLKAKLTYKNDDGTCVYLAVPQSTLLRNSHSKNENRTT